MDYYQRAVSIAAMHASSSTDDFLNRVAPNLSQPQVPGALPAMTRTTALALKTLKPLDLVIVWGIGDFEPTSPCSSYYNPASPWYNVFYGLYAMRSYKPGRAAWGYDRGRPNFDEFLQEVAGVDYNYFTAGQFGCPPEMMSFKVLSVSSPQSRNGWDFADVTAQVPSGLHDPTAPPLKGPPPPHSHDAPWYPANMGNYIAFGIPDPSFLTGHSPYEPVEMVGRFYMRQLSVTVEWSPITLVWGTACPNTAAGKTLLETIMQALEKTYLQLGKL